MKLLPIVNKFKRFIKKLFNMSIIIPMENLKWFCCCCCCFCLICNWNKYFEEIFLQALNFELYQILRKVKNPSYIHSLNCTWVTFLLNFPLKKNTHPFKSAFEELENELMFWNSVKSGNPNANSHIDLVLKVFVREAKFARVNLSIHLHFWLLVVWTDSLLKEKVLEKLVH